MPVHHVDLLSRKLADTYLTMAQQDDVAWHICKVESSAVALLLYRAVAAKLGWPSCMKHAKENPVQARCYACV